MSCANEVRADLGPEEAKLRPHYSLSGTIQFGQFELGRDELSHFAAKTENAGRCGAVESTQCADHCAVHLQRHDDPRLQFARSAGGTDQILGAKDLGLANGQGSGQRRVNEGPVDGVDSFTGQDAFEVGQDHSARSQK